MGKLRLGFLVSGRGTNLQAVIDAIERGEVDAQIVIVVCNHTGVPALARSARHNIPAQVMLQKDYPSRLEHHLAILELLQGYGVELVVLAGWDRIMAPEFVQAFPFRMINTHPALLPAFGGKGMVGEAVHQAVLDSGAKVSGCTVHFVTEDVDAGPIILQAAVPVYDHDTIGSLTARVTEQEHRLLPQAIELICQGRVSIEGRRVFIDGPVNWSSPYLIANYTGELTSASYTERMG